MFSYGEDNIFVVSPNVTQLIGKNGDGKSSIAAIIEELLYNKNSRGIKKGDIANRYTDRKGYEGYVDFSVGGVDYRVSKVVASSSKVTLTQDGEDISGHTATQTYKNIESLLKMDFNTFTKLAYQSMVSSLDFLSATDANRKKFLVSLLGLEKYVEAEKSLKEALKDSKSELDEAQGSLAVITTWLEKNSNIPEAKETIPVPEHDPSIEDILVNRKAELSNTTLHNKVVKENLQNIKAYESIKEVPEAPISSECSTDILSEKTKASETTAVLKAAKTSAKAQVTKVASIKENCHACGSPLDVGDKASMLEDAETELEKAEAALTEATDRLTEISTRFSETREEEILHENFLKYLSDLKVAEAKLDSSKPTELFSAKDLEDTIADLKKRISDKQALIDNAINYNTSVTASNATIDYKQKQLEEFKADLLKKQVLVEDVSNIHTRLDVLAKALGNKGLIAYKVESMVKVFENLINEYLQVLADGEFALGFSVEDTKLVLNTYNRGAIVDIKSLSSGEFNRVNTATLLAVRKMMTSISKTDLNLLILDEVVSVLDQQGKDTLIEVLLKEPNLSSVVVSHGYEHPLASKVTVRKENKISRLYNE